MMIRWSIAFLAVLAGASAPRAQDIASIMDPTAKQILFLFQTSPEGADIEYRGAAEGLTNQKLWLDPRYLDTLRIVVEGYLPCTYEQGTKVKRRFAGAGVGIEFTCRLHADPSRAQPPGWTFGSDVGP